MPLGLIHQPATGSREGKQVMLYLQTELIMVYICFVKGKSNLSHQAKHLASYFRPANCLAIGPMGGQEVKGFKLKVIKVR